MRRRCACGARAARNQQPRGLRCWMCGCHPRPGCRRHQALAGQGAGQQAGLGRCGARGQGGPL
eukprot:366655-Lingulodinium_polyedra.AAC.1